MCHHSARDSRKGALGRAGLLGNPKDRDFEGYAKCPVYRYLSTGALFGEPGGGLFARTFE